MCVPYLYGVLHLTTPGPFGPDTWFGLFVLVCLCSLYCFSLPDGILLVSHWAKHMPRLYSFVTVVGYWNDDVVECFKGGSSGVG